MQEYPPQTVEATHKCLSCIAKCLQWIDNQRTGRLLDVENSWDEAIFRTLQRIRLSGSDSFKTGDSYIFHKNHQSTRLTSV